MKNNSNLDKYFLLKLGNLPRLNWPKSIYLNWLNWKSIYRINLPDRGDLYCRPFIVGSRSRRPWRVFRRFLKIWKALVPNFPNLQEFSKNSSWLPRTVPRNDDKWNKNPAPSQFTALFWKSVFKNRTGTVACYIIVYSACTPLGRFSGPPVSSRTQSEWPARLPYKVLSLRKLFFSNSLLTYWKLQ